MKTQQKQKLKWTKQLRHMCRSLNREVLWIKTTTKWPTFGSHLTGSSVRPPCCTDSWWVYSGTANMSRKLGDTEGKPICSPQSHGKHKGNRGQREQRVAEYIRTLNSCELWSNLILSNPSVCNKTKLMMTLKSNSTSYQKAYILLVCS